MSSPIVPVGIVTRNRTTYLHATLCSLSATYLPVETPVAVFDDGSDEEDALKYLYSDECFSLDRVERWPNADSWFQKKLDFLPVWSELSGISGRVAVNHYAEASGVVNASNWVLKTLFTAHRSAQYVCILQNDILFSPDWYTRLAKVISDELKRERPALISGCVISRNPNFKHTSFTTAQCLAVPRRAWDEMSFFHTNSNTRSQYDETLSRLFRESGCGIRLVRPACVQHIGIRSSVYLRSDPYAHFLDGVGRYCHYFDGTYAWSDHVAYFKQRPVVKGTGDLLLPSMPNR